jgi:hypothetical protein
MEVLNMDEEFKQSYCYHNPSYSKNDIEKCVQMLKLARETVVRNNQQWWVDFFWLFSSYIPAIIAANILAYWLYKEKATKASLFFSIIALVLVESIHQRNIVNAILFLVVSLFVPTYSITGLALIFAICYISNKSYNKYHSLQKLPWWLIILFVSLLLGISTISLQYLNFRLPPM